MMKTYFCSGYVGTPPEERLWPMWVSDQQLKAQAEIQKVQSKNKYSFHTEDSHDTLYLTVPPVSISIYTRLQSQLVGVTVTHDC